MWYCHQFTKQSLNTSSLAHALVADLRPGDVLYVPPYWWHHPISISPCISLASWSQANLWSDSLTQIYYKRELAFASTHNTLSHRTALLRAHFNGLFNALFNSTLEIMSAVALERRWRFMGVCGSCDSIVVETLSTADMQRTDADVEFVAKTLREMMPLANPSGNYKKAVMSFEVFDFLERMVARTLGVDKVFAFLCCRMKQQQ
jgi:hypothetical protein